MEEGRLSKITWTLPAMSSDSAGPAPLNGTWSMSQPVMDLNSSPDRCTDVPLLEDAILIFPGFALQYAMNSATVLAGKELVTSITFGVLTSPATGAMSRMKSKGRFL